MLSFLLACAPGAELLTTEPMSAFGHERVELEVDADLVVSDAWVGGVRAYELEQDGSALSFTVQGGDPGEAEVLLMTDLGEVVVDGAVSYLEPVDPLFDRMTGIGASLTMGVQDGVPTQHGQLHNPGAQLARAAGAYYPMPLLVDPLFPTIEPVDIGPAPDCKAPQVASHVTSAASEVLLILNDEEGEFDYALARIDPDIVVQNAGVGGFRVSDLTVSVDDFILGFLAHLALAPYGEVNSDIPFSQVEHVLSLDPTLVVSFDTFGNDLIAAVVLGSRPELDNITDEEIFRDGVEELMAQLGASEAQVFLSNSPRPGLLPAARALVAQAEDPEATQAIIDEADAICDHYNAILQAEADRYDNIHVVDGHGFAEQLLDEGLEAGGQQLDVYRFGGLLSLDGVHFTDTGYAAFAQLFTEAIGQELGVDIAPIDLDAVAEADRRSPRALEEAGLDLEACDR